MSFELTSMENLIRLPIHDNVIRFVKRKEINKCEQVLAFDDDFEFDSKKCIFFLWFDRFLGDMENIRRRSMENSSKVNRTINETCEQDNQLLMTCVDCITDRILIDCFCFFMTRFSDIRLVRT